MIGYIRANIAATIFGGLAAIFALIAVVQTVKLNGFLWFDGERDKRVAAEKKADKCEAARKQDRATYEQAQRDAKAKNDADVARIKAEQEKVNAEAKSRYSRDLRRLRAGGLRKDLATPQSNAGCARASSVPDTAAGASSEELCVPRADIMRAAEAELRLNALIDWVSGQLGVRR